MNAWLEQAAGWAWGNAIAASVLAVMLLGLRRVWRAQVAPRWLCLAGWLVVLRSVLPSPIVSPWGGWQMMKPVNSPNVESSVNLSVPVSSPPIDNAAFAVSPAVPSNELHARLPDAASAWIPAPTSPESTAVSPEPCDWQSVAAWIWAFGVFLFAGAAVIRHARFMLILGRECRVVRDNALIQSAQTAAATAGLRRTPELLVRGGGGSPFLCGLWRPRIVLPEQTLAALTPCELRHVLMHEMLHAAHRDLPMNWVLTAVRALHWWNPFLHIAIRALLADRELLRDGEAVTRLAEPDASAGYGRTLLKIALTPAVPVLTPGLSPFFRTETELKHRITMISQSTRHPRLRAGIAAALLAACSVPVFTTAQEVPASAAESPPAKSETPSPVPENSQAIPLNSVPALLPPPVNSLHAPVPDPPAPAAADGKKRQSSPLEVLKAMAGRLREKGLSDEADSIEAQIALIGAAAAQEEVLALRAEMATMRAAIAKLEAQPRMGVPLTSAEKLRAEYAALLEAGWGSKHPKVLATAGQILKTESLLRKRRDTAATPDAQNSPAAPRASVAEDSLPFGVAVIGKRGFVYSPYAEEKGYVDVKEISSGTRVKCPYSGKLFRVP